MLLTSITTIPLLLFLDTAGPFVIQLAMSHFHDILASPFTDRVASQPRMKVYLLLPSKHSTPTVHSHGLWGYEHHRLSLIFLHWSMSAPFG